LAVGTLLAALGLMIAFDNHAGGAQPVSDGVPEGYVKVFDDEFNEPHLDTSKWWTRLIYSDGALDVLNDEQQRYREDNNHVMTGHSLVLTARKGGVGSDGYLSGMIRSKTTFKYGYFEARMKVPGGVGVRPAFWLNSARRDSDGKMAWPPEIDIAEIANNGVEDTPRMLHVGLISHGAQGDKGLYADRDFHADGYWSAPESLADDFHVFAALWESDAVSIFLDTRLIYKAEYRWVYDDGSPAGLAHILFDLAIGGPKWAGRHGVDDAAFPQGLEVDYVRVYQKLGQRMTGVDTIGKDLCPLRGKC
jgi:beta-glucanase (GH16 family)